MYTVVANNHLESLNTRNSFLPSSSWKEIKRNDVTLLGRFHSTSQFSVQPDGTVVLTFNSDEANDSFTVAIQMAKITCTFDLRRQHWAYAQPGSNQSNSKICSKQQVFTVAIGDIFKHYYKSNVKSITSVTIKKKKKSGRNVKDEEEIDDENEDALVNEFVAKSMKIQLCNNDVRAIIGSIENWDKHDLRLWDILLDQGFLTTIGSDFVSFCNTFIILPMYYYNAAESLANCLTRLSSHGMVKKLVRLFLTGEDPSAKMWANIPPRDYFEVKPLAKVLDENSKDLIERYDECRYVKVMKYLVRELNAGNTADLKENYPPQEFESILEVESTYPLHALRTIHLSSWCATDFNLIFGMVCSAESLAKCERVKCVVKKRGKFQKYQSYDPLLRGGCRCSMCIEPHSRKNKFDVVKRELALN